MVYFMKNFAKILCSAALLSAPSITLADPKPEGAQRADPQTVANFYIGKSHKWNSCNGGIYFDSNWEARAYCNRDGPSVGMGKWIIYSDGKLCNDLTWYWPEGDGVGSKKEGITDRDCFDHVIDSNGDLWSRWQGEKNDPNAWWKRQGNRNIVKGDAFRREVKRLRRKLDI